MIKGTKVKVVSRLPPNNKKTGTIVHMFKDSTDLWLTIVDYPDGERYIAIEGTDKIKTNRNPNQTTLDDF